MVFCLRRRFYTKNCGMAYLSGSKLCLKWILQDKLSPQDGRFNLKYRRSGRPDFRVSSLPTVHGENIVLRVLDKSISIKPLDKLGFVPKIWIVSVWLNSSRRDYYCYWAWGVGKSTSLYSMINRNNKVEVNIQTLGRSLLNILCPWSVRTRCSWRDFDFADGIKALLRQDPDIIFIGEIRDGVTGEMALKAAMTGHQVARPFIPMIVWRYSAFGGSWAEARMISGLLSGFCSAALFVSYMKVVWKNVQMRKMWNFRSWSISAASYFKARQGGCQMCSGQGYKGRLDCRDPFGWNMDDDKKREQNRRWSVLLNKKGSKSMRDDGILKILDGITERREEVAGAAYALLEFFSLQWFVVASFSQGRLPFSL